MQALDISQSRVSHNLRILEEAGLLKSRKNGVWMVYSVDWQSANSHATALTELLKNLPISDKTLAEDRVRLKRSCRVGPKALKK